MGGSERENTKRSSARGKSGPHEQAPARVGIIRTIAEQWILRLGCAFHSVVYDLLKQERSWMFVLCSDRMRTMHRGMVTNPLPI